MRWTWRKFGVAAAVGTGALLIPAAAAWACLPVANLTAKPATAQAGQPVNVIGSEFYGSNPVQIHFNALDGPVLGSFTPDGNGAFTGMVTIPANAPTGPAVLVATEAAATDTSPTGGSSPGVPTRTVVQVVGAGGSAPLALTPTGAGRTGVLTSSSSVGTGVLLLVGLGVFGAALFLAGGIALMTGGRRRETATAKVQP